MASFGGRLNARLTETTQKALVAAAWDELGSSQCSDFDVFWESLRNYASTCPITGVKSLSTHEIRAAFSSDQCPAALKKVLSSPRFILAVMKHHSNGHFRVPVRSLELVVDAVYAAVSNRAHLMSFAKQSAELMTYGELESYVRAFLSVDQKFSEEDIEFAVCLYMRKFAFFLDAARTERFRITDILSCGLFEEMHLVGNCSMESFLSSGSFPWFSKEMLKEALEEYRVLNTKSSGLLSKEDLHRMRTLNPEFVRRLYSQVHTYDYGWIDFGCFCDILLALQNPRHLATWRFYFRIFDMDNDGFITIDDIRELLRGVLSKMTMQLFTDMLEHNIDPEQVVLSEILDLISANGKTRLSLQDIASSGMACTFFQILVEVEKFIAYDDREDKPSMDPYGSRSEHPYP